MTNSNDNMPPLDRSTLPADPIFDNCVCVIDIGWHGCRLNGVKMPVREAVSLLQGARS